jgi:hypothetical protein
VSARALGWRGAVPRRPNAHQHGCEAHRHWATRRVVGEADAQRQRSALDGETGRAKPTNDTPRRRRTTSSSTATAALSGPRTG